MPDTSRSPNSAVQASKTLIDMFKAAAKEFGIDRGSRMAAALTYYTLFALVPLLFVATAAAGFVFGDPSVVEDIVATVEDVAGESIADQVSQIIESAEANAQASLVIGLALAVFTGSGLFLQVQGVLNTIFHAPDDLDRGLIPFIRKRAVGAVAVVILGILVLTPILAVSGLNWVRDLLPDGLPGLEVVLRVSVPIVSFAMLVLVVGFTFQGLTAIKIPWRAARRGGAFTAVAGLLGAWGVGLYLSQVGPSGALAALGGLAILLFFAYLMWSVYVFGAELTKVYADYLRHGIVAPPSVSEAGPVSPLVEREVEAEVAKRTPVGTMAALVVGLVIGLLGNRRG